MSIGEWMLVITVGGLLVAVLIALRSEPGGEDLEP